MRMYVIHGDTGTAGWGRIGGRVGGGGGRGGWRRRFSVVVAFVEGFVEVLVLVLVRELVNWWWAEMKDGGDYFCHATPEHHTPPVITRGQHRFCADGQLQSLVCVLID